MNVKVYRCVCVCVCVSVCELKEDRHIDLKKERQTQCKGIEVRERVSERERSSLCYWRLSLSCPSTSAETI
jgi:hypothetical protein